eukprot:c826_g1_i1 orf=255-602(+)
MFVNYALMTDIIDSPPDPSSVHEALAHEPWRRAIQAKLDSIERNRTWELVPRPPKRKIIGLRWLFKTKYKADGSLDKHKARLHFFDFLEFSQHPVLRGGVNTCFLQPQAAPFLPS